MKVIDPDDPSANAAGNPVDADLLGGDNDTPFNGDLIATAQTDAAGVATRNFLTGIIAGDNHRVAATLKPAGLGDIDNDNVPPSGQSPPNDAQPWGFIGRVSHLLTVWRKLHVELDSWGPGGEPPAITNGLIRSTGAEANHPGHAWAKIQGLNLGAGQNGRLEGGRLTVNAGGTYVIVDNIAESNGDKVYVDDPNGTLGLEVGRTATATDDDAAFTPRKPDISLMNPKYKPAYVGIEEVTGESTLNIPFVLNLSDMYAPVEAATAPGRSGNLNTSHTFWASQVVLGYQGPTSNDHDPDAIYHFWSDSDKKQGEPALLGETIGPEYSGYNNVSVLFEEGIRDRAAWLAVFHPLYPDEIPLFNAADIERMSVVHEVGHQFGLEHGPGGIMMLGALNPALEFLPADLQAIRTSADIEH
jgi:hypothetical protein